jgi:hypothetical protein
MYGLLRKKAAGSPSIFSSPGAAGGSSSGGGGSSTPKTESWDYALTDETSVPSTGVSIIDGIPYNFIVTDVQIYLTVAPTGSQISVDLLQETGLNTNVFQSILSTLPAVRLNEFTSTTNPTKPVFSNPALSVGRRIAYKIFAIDSNNVAKGIKVSVIGHQ